MNKVYAAFHAELKLLDYNFLSDKTKVCNTQLPVFCIAAYLILYLKDSYRTF